MMYQDLKFFRDNEIDEDAINRHVDKHFDDKNWRKIFKSASKDCTEKLKSKELEIQMKYEKHPFNIKRQECNVISMAYATCINFESFMVSVWQK